jgi:hypothetical protein
MPVILQVFVRPGKITINKTLMAMADAPAINARS